MHPSLAAQLADEHRRQMARDAWRARPAARPRRAIARAVRRRVGWALVEAGLRIACLPSEP